MTQPEAEVFEQLRDSGKLTFFRVGFCEVCEKEVIKGKKYCSIKCAKKQRKERKIGMTNDGKSWVWDIELDALIGCIAHFETKDGIRREGRISKILKETFWLAGEEVDIPRGFELNGDPMDEINVDRLIRLDLMT